MEMALLHGCLSIVYKPKPHYFDQVVQADLGHGVRPNGNIVVNVLVQGLSVHLGQQTYPAHDGPEAHLQENESRVDLGHRAHPQGKVVPVRINPVQVVLKDVPVRVGLLVHHKGNSGLVHANLAHDGLVHLGEDVNHLVVDLGWPVLHKEEVVQVLDRAHLAGVDLDHGSLAVLPRDEGSLLHGILVLHRESNKPVEVAIDHGRLIQPVD